jgi:UDP:flavonoid glycosyltransferase YjiC (YdhE family)
MDRPAGTVRSGDGLRLLVAAFGDPGHSFPAIALARELRRRGHEVLVETWEHWRDAVEGEGLGFTAAQEYTVYPPPGPDTPDGQTAAAAARSLARLMDGYRPDLVVSDILTLAPTLAAEVAGVPHATLIPHVYPVQRVGMPMYSIGMRPPRTAVGRLGWRATGPLLAMGLRRGRDELNEIRARLGLGPLDRFHGGISELLAVVGTFPQLEYPREWPKHVRVTGPLFFEMAAEEVEIPEGDGPLVVVAPSTSQDPRCELVRVALEALADEPVRVLASLNGMRPNAALPTPANAAVVDWVVYSQVMPAADLVVTHGGHGTVARALVSGRPVLCCPAVGDMAENGARVAWAGAGLMLPWRLTRPPALRLAVRRLLAGQSFAARAGEIADWARDHDGADRGAELIEQLAGS